MEIKKVNINEIYWTLKQWNIGEQANYRLKECLGDELVKFFAKCKVGAGFYIWDTPTGRWMPLEEATAEDLDDARNKWAEIQQQVRSKLSTKSDLAERILGIPNEKFLYYRRKEDNTVDLLVTGWGFRNFIRQRVTPITRQTEKSGHPVTVAFTINGEKTPYRPFQIVAEKKNNNLVTDADGNGSLGNLDLGKVVTIIDTVTGKSFSFTVEAIKSEYLFDVTLQKDDQDQDHGEKGGETMVVVEPVTITVTVLSSSGQPVVHKTISFKQGDKELSCELDNNGQCFFTADFFVNDVLLLAKMSDSDQIPFILEKDETEYVLQEQNLTVKRNPWLEVLMGILLLLALAGIAIAFYYAIDELSDIINQNIF